jgi:hypothetical protein
MSAKTLSPLLRLGTSSFTAEGWETSFYPKGMQPRDYLSYYATQFDTLEVDATFYRIPAESTVKDGTQRRGFGRELFVRRLVGIC